MTLKMQATKLLMKLSKETVKGESFTSLPRNKPIIGLISWSLAICYPFEAIEAGESVRYMKLATYIGVVLQN